MKEVLNKIFLNNNFENIPIENPFQSDISFWGNYSETSTNFYLVLYTDEISQDFIIEKVPAYFDAIKTLKEGYDERIDKNLSMLICLDNRNIVGTSENKKIFEIEEDPYFFKKYLLTYDQGFKEVKKEILKGDDINITINNVINDVEKFNDFKNGVCTNDVKLYEICAKLMTKIPFISLNHKQSNLEDLSRSILSRLEKKQLIESRNNILQHFELDDEEFIDKIVGVIDLESNDYE